MYIWVDNRALYVCVPPKTETVHGELSFWLYCKRSDSKPNCPIGGIYTIEQELRTTELSMWTSSFSPEQIGTLFSSVFQEYHSHFHFLSLYSFYLNKKYRLVHSPSHN